MNEGENNHIENTTTETSQNVSVAELLGSTSVSNPTPIEQKTVTEEPVKEVAEEAVTQTQEIDENAVVEFLKSKGKEVNSIDDLFKEPEVKEVNPYDEILSDEDKAYLNFKKETGGSREDFDAINRNWDEVEPIELLKAKILKETGINFTDEDAAEYLSSEINVDITDEEMSAVDKVKLKSYLKDFIAEQKAAQNNYKSTTEKPKQQPETANQEFVTLDNGTVMKKADYDNKVAEYNKYVETNKEAVNSVTDYSFSISIDENGTKKELNYKFDLTDEDRHSMLSVTTDTSKYINENYLTENGFDQKRFNEDMFWSVPKNREKVIGALLHQARAEAIEQLMKERGNVNLSPHRGLQTSAQKEGVKTMSISDIINS